jgi:hypothetical protein
MILIYHQMNPAEKLFPRKPLEWRYLTREERKRVLAMIQESNDNDLLQEMLRWFSAQYMGEDKEVVEATKVFRNLVVHSVLKPKSYQVE